MLRSATGLLVGKGLSVGAGLLFWAIAARSATPREVGLTAAAVSSVMLCTQVASLGTGAAVIVALARRQRLSDTLDTAFTLATCAGVVSAGLVLVSFPSMDSEVNSVLGLTAFVVAVVAGTLVIVLDQALVALGRGETAAVRYAVAGLVTTAAAGILAFLVTTEVRSGTLLACWSLGAVAAAAWGAVQLWRRAGYRPRLDLHAGRWRGLLGIGVPNQVLTFTERAPGLVFPVLVAHVVSPATAAYWYPAWMMAWAAYSAPMLTGIVQFAEAVRSPERMLDTVRTGLRWSLASGAAIALTLALAADPLLQLLGGNYRDQASSALRVLALGLFPYSVLHTYNATCRALHRLTEAIVVGGVLAVGLCVLPLLAPGDEVVGMAAVWVAVLAVAALFLVPRLLVLLRGRTP